MKGQLAAAHAHEATLGHEKEKAAWESAVVIAVLGACLAATWLVVALLLGSRSRLLRQTGEDEATMPRRGRHGTKVCAVPELFRIRAAPELFGIGSPLLRSEADTLSDTSGTPPHSDAGGE